jgi:hypothetical protein
MCCRDRATLPLVADYYRHAQELAYPSTHALATVLDVNDGGTLEIVVPSTSWEGMAITIYTVQAGTVQQVASLGCQEEEHGSSVRQPEPDISRCTISYSNSVLLSGAKIKGGLQ